MNPADRIKLAKDLVGNAVLKEILDKLESETVKAWRVSQTPIERECLHADVKAIEKLRGKIYAASAGNPNAGT